MKKIWLSAITILTLISCGKSDSSNNTNLEISANYNVYGNHDRKLETDIQETPFKWIGQLISPNGGTCSASLVGENLILTAAHCIFSNGSILKGNYQFLLGRIENYATAKSGVKRLHWGTNWYNNRKNDWAILELTKPLGKKHGYFGTRHISGVQDSNNFNLSLSGYSPINQLSNSLYTQENCSIRNHFTNGSYAHDCDAGPGDSGAPIYKCKDKKCYIYAIHVAAEQNGSRNALHLDQYNDNYFRNVAAPASQFSHKINQLRR